MTQQGFFMGKGFVDTVDLRMARFRFASSYNSQKQVRFFISCKIFGPDSHKINQTSEMDSKKEVEVSG